MNYDCYDVVEEDKTGDEPLATSMSENVRCLVVTKEQGGNLVDYCIVPTPNIAKIPNGYIPNDDDAFVVMWDDASAPGWHAGDEVEIYKGAGWGTLDEFSYRCYRPKGWKP